MSRQQQEAHLSSDHQPRRTVSSGASEAEDELALNAKKSPTKQKFGDRRRVGVGGPKIQTDRGQKNEKKKQKLSTENKRKMIFFSLKTKLSTSDDGFTFSTRSRRLAMTSTTTTATTTTTRSSTPTCLSWSSGNRGRSWLRRSWQRPEMGRKS